MRIFCCALLTSLMGIGNHVFGQPVATDFSLPVQPASSYYNAGPFLSLNKGKYHLGEDWNGNGRNSTDYGDPVYPIAVGKVIKALDQKGSIGKVVVVKHLLPDNQVVYSYYFHLSKILVKVNDIVYSNKPLGNIGDANGYYVGAAHLHFEIRRVNQSASSSYYQTLTVATARKYRDPSLFIDDRREEIGIGNVAGNTFSSSDEDIQVSNYAPASLAHVTYRGKTLSLPLAIEAGWIDSTVHVREQAANRWIATTLSDFVFSPNADFKIKFLQDCFLMIVVPGHNFQASRARDDMILAAWRAGFTRVKLETLTDLGDDGSSTFDLRSLCFDDGPNTGVGCLVQATNHDNPLLRYVIWYDPSTNAGIGDWTELDQNDID